MAMEALTTAAVESWAERVRTVAIAPTELEQMRTAVQNYASLAVTEGLRQTLLRNSATKRARSALHELKGEGLIESGSFERAMKLIDVLFTPNTIYASIAPDDGGVTFYWRAGEMSVEIDIYLGEGYWWRVQNVAAESYTDHSTDLPIERLKYSLNWFSKDVDRENPNWRRQTI
ncbi:hypothetical protein B1790_29615 [Mycobacterium sp. AT1]|nr:hypothetical protein B1790_29615 [Mycobacterium sp. AT1]